MFSSSNGLGYCVDFTMKRVQFLLRTFCECCSLRQNGSFQLDNNLRFETQQHSSLFITNIIINNVSAYSSMVEHMVYIHITKVRFLLST